METIHVGEFVIGPEEKKAINAVLDSGRISEGKRVREFESKWAEFVGTKHCVLLNSGTSALLAGLIALKHHSHIKDCSKVITTPLNYVATSNAVVTANLEPAFVDVDRETFVMTPDNVKALLESANDPSQYSVMLPVHLMGYPCDMDKMNWLAKKYGLVTFEDAAEAHGTLYKGKRAGSMSLLSAFSFYMAHNIQAGEMGAIATDDPEIKRLVMKIKANGRACDCPVCTRWEGICPQISAYKGEEDFDPRFAHDIIGYNFKTMEFPAAFALVQLERAGEIIGKRQEFVRYLNEGLEKYGDVLQLPKYSKDISYLAYPMVIKDFERISRKKLRLELEKRQIETRPLFGCIPTQQPAYAYLSERYRGKLPNAEFLGSHGFYIGCHQYLSYEQLDHVIKSFGEILRGVSK
jgi:CDP-6-deoxy-D-xylo-4-hexulose-3-dehydrase